MMRYYFFKNPTETIQVAIWREEERWKYCSVDKRFPLIPEKRKTRIVTLQKGHLANMLDIENNYVQLQSDLEEMYFEADD